MKLKTCLLILLAAVMIANCGGCISAEGESLPEDTVEEFEAAMNAMDLQGMLDCMDEGTVKGLTASLDIVMGVAGAVAGVDLGISAEDLLAAMPLFQGFAEEYSDGQVYPQVDFEVYETRLKAKRATVYFTEKYSGEPMTLNMKKGDGKWRFTLNTKEISREDADRVLLAGQEKVIVDSAETDSGPYSTEKIEVSIWDLFDREKLEEVVRQVLKAQGNE